MFLHKHTGGRTTKGSPSGEEGRADRAADRHVAVATRRGRDVAGGRQGWWKKTEEEEEGGTMKRTISFACLPMKTMTFKIQQAEKGENQTAGKRLLL